VHHRWGLPSLLPPRRRSDGLYLLLRCTACGRGRTHFVQQVLVDVNTLDKKAKGEAISYDPYIMDREIICPKCGAVDRYEMTSAAHLRLVGSENLPAIVESMVKGRKPKTVEFQPPKWLHPFRSSVFGRPMHPLDGLAEYRRRIEINPNDAQLHLKLGNLLRTIYRSQAALAEHRRAYTLDPNHAEIALACGMSEHDFGDKAAAKACYERAARLELQGKGLLGIVRSDTLAGAAFEGLGRLKRGLSSPAYTATDAEPVEPGEKVVRPRRKRGRGRRKGR